MTDDEKAEVRQKAEKNAQQLNDGLAPLYLGRSCPLKDGKECDGPKCMVYTPLNDNPQRPDAVTGGVCGIPLGVHQLMQLNEKLDLLAKQMGNFALANAPRILPGSGRG